MHFPNHRIIAIFIAFSFLAGFAEAGPAQEATQRMKDRLAQVDNLKTEGSVGENAEGFLEARTTLGPRESSIIEAENADRKTVYAEVAARIGQPVSTVGQQRALRIAEIAGKGVWLKKPDGVWYQKP